MVYLRIKNASTAYYPRYLVPKYEYIRTGEHAGKRRFTGYEREAWTDTEDRMDKRRRYKDGKYSHYLYLVESKRINGTVKQCNIEYLGGIHRWTLKDLFWLATGTKAFKMPWRQCPGDPSLYPHIKPFPMIRSQYGRFNVNKTLQKLVRKVQGAPCIADTLINQGVSYPFPKTFFETFDKTGILFYILQGLERFLRKALANNNIMYYASFSNMVPITFSEEGRERAIKWLEEWLPNVVSSVTGLRYTLQQEANQEAAL